MNFQKIKKLQKKHGYDKMQSMIDSGLAWHMEGSIGREAMSLLQSGVCMLPKISHRDYYGNLVPSRDMLKPGTKGTLSNSQNFWKKVESGETYIW
ncbi:MAG: hypothetical protein ACOC4B_01660 [Bacteroidota bacterium]